MKKGIFVVNFNDVLYQNSKDSMLDAARRWGVDYIEINENNCPIEIESIAPDHCFMNQLKHHKPSFLRFAPFNITGYDWLLILDADMIISGDAPNPFELFTPEQFCVASNEPSEAYHLSEPNVRKAYWNKHKGKYNLPDYNDPRLHGYIFFNSGTILASKQHHGDIFQRGWEIAVENEWQQWPQQTPLNFAVVEAILAGKLNFHRLGSEWNQREFWNDGFDLVHMSAYIYHFASTTKHLAGEVNWRPCILHRREHLGWLLNSLGLFGEGVEIGVWKALFSESILSHWHGKKLYLVDPYIEYDEYIQNMSWDNTAYNKNHNFATESMEKQFPTRHEFITKFSAKATKDFENEQLDFIYIDGNHSYEFVKEDLELWFPKVRVGGIVAGHDFLDWPEKGFGVKQAVTEFISNRREVLYVDRSKWPTWFFIKER